MKRYSDTLSPELQDITLRILAQHTTGFQSCAFEIMDMGDEYTVCRWRRAQKHPEADSWIVKEYQTAPYLQDNPDVPVNSRDIETIPAEQKILMNTACFIDALHACASFEVFETEKGKIPAGRTRKELGNKHYKTAGEDEGIPFDLNSGLPVPTANGVVLTEKCTLPALSEEFEMRSKGNLTATKAAIEDKENRDVPYGIKRLMDVFFAAAHPGFWLTQKPYSAEYDRYLNELMDQNAPITERSEHTRKIGNLTIWTSNYPYCYGHPYGRDQIEILPARRTVKRLHKYIEKAQRAALTFTPPEQPKIK